MAAAAAAAEASRRPGRQQHRVLMVSDFFYPNFGGVENHIYYLSQCLLQRGHKVVVLTHAYGNRAGVRYMTNGLKVYYVPRLPFYLQSTLPTLFGSLPIVRAVLVRERITLLHGHQAFSALCHEAILHARTMGCGVTFTDHSLYGFSDIGSIHMNKVLQFTMSDCQHAICVSHTSKENTSLRSGIPPHRVSVIPNAVDTSMFQPDPGRQDPGGITIVIISRLVYRKGADLLVEVIPEIRFVVGGDGPKRVRLEEMREKHALQERVEMLGAVPHKDVQGVLTRGQIFLNSSLTEAFCIALLEAASCGLLCVSTRVGGVPEVLPPDMLVLAEPAPADIVQAIENAIELLPSIDPCAMHSRVTEMYSWQDIAERTELVYDRIATAPSDNLLTRLSRYYSCGPWAGKLFCLVVTIDHLLWHFLEWWQTPSHRERNILEEVTATHQAIRALDKSISSLEMELAAARAAGTKDGTPNNAFLGGASLGGSSEPRPKVLAVIGVNTAFSSRKRRDSLRETWVPRGERLSKLEKEKGMVVRFVIGHSATPGGVYDQAIDDEDAEYHDFLRVVHEEKYLTLSAKTKIYFATAVLKWEADFYVKVDDDVHVNLGIMGSTLVKHRAKPRVYLGCMKSGPVLAQKGVKYAEPEYWKFGEEGNKAILHTYTNEDVSLGSWLIGLDVDHVDDRAMCCGTPPDCEWKAQAGNMCLASFDWPCSGVCKSVERMKEVHTRCDADLPERFSWAAPPLFELLKRI
eukprot:SM000307S11686  [mRNA]  locus=s307:68156:76880:+ [translate_table: standard]